MGGIGGLFPGENPFGNFKRRTLTGAMTWDWTLHEASIPWQVTTQVVNAPPSGHLDWGTHPLQLSFNNQDGDIDLVFQSEQWRAIRVLGRSIFKTDAWTSPFSPRSTGDCTVLAEANWGAHVRMDSRQGGLG